MKEKISSMMMEFLNKFFNKLVNAFRSFQSLKVWSQNFTFRTVGSRCVLQNNRSKCCMQSFESWTVLGFGQKQEQNNFERCHIVHVWLDQI